jgi:hypothetical protein
MVELLRSHNLPVAKIEFGVLYQGPQNLDEVAPKDQQVLREHRAAAQNQWGLDSYYFELCDDIPTYLSSLDKLSFNSNSQTRAIADKDFEALAFHLSSKCDACIFSEFCLRSAAQSQDLSLLPYLTQVEKSALHKQGIRDVSQLAALKTPRQTPPVAGDPHAWNEIETVAAHQAHTAALAGNRQVGHRLDELIHRAHAFSRTPDSRVTEN